MPRKKATPTAGVVTTPTTTTEEKPSDKTGKETAKADKAQSNGHVNGSTADLPVTRMHFFLDHRNRPMVQFTDPEDGRTLPLANMAVKGELFSDLADRMGRAPSTQDLNIYLMRCSGAAL